MTERKYEITGDSVYLPVEKTVEAIEKEKISRVKNTAENQENVSSPSKS